MNDVGPNNLKDVKTLPGSKIIGVFQDFHIRSLHQAIEPMAVYLTRDRDFYYPNRFIISLQPQNVKETMAKIQEVYENFDKKRPFETYFLDQNFARQYETDQKRMTIFFSFSIFTILIACLGLFGLASFTAEQRTKEIGIRKVLGADISGLLYLITKDFLQLVLVANVLAFPVAYWVMNNWLQNFAYRTKLYENWLVFLLSGFVAFLIAVLTVSYQAYRAATVNPVKVLKDE
jgi:putative ABC transport system permease protein